MHTENRAKNTLLKIITIGLLRIRALGNSGDPQACSIEADHLHNLPSLVHSFSLERLLYYYRVEREAFIKQSRHNTEQFHDQWQELDSLIRLAEGPSSQK